MLNHSKKLLVIKEKRSWLPPATSSNMVYRTKPGNCMLTTYATQSPSHI